MFRPNKLQILRILKSNSKCFSTVTVPKPVKLAYAVYEQETNQNNLAIPLVIAHGLFGSKQNWTSLCKVYSQKINPPRKVIALDLRNHGESTHTEEHSYSHLVEDVKHFLLDNGISKVALMGHSMGGRCAMLFALRYPEFLEKLIVVDISPINLSPNIHEMPKILEIMGRVKMPSNVPMSQARNIVDQQLAEVITEKDVRAFILTNLTTGSDSNNSYKWRVNIPTLVKHFHEIAKFGSQEGLQYTGDTLFIGGEKSSYIPYHENCKPKRLVYAVDLRNHGDSPHSSDNSYDDLILDVLKFIRSMGLNKVALMGHDIGGRVGMLISLKFPEVVHKMIVVDTSPISTSYTFKIYPEILRILNNMIFPPNLPMPQARAHAINCLSRVVQNKGLMSVILMNLTQNTDGSYTWHFNKKALLDNLQELTTFPTVHNVRFEEPVLFVGGGKSDHIQRSDYPKILQLFPKAELKYIEGAGHWVHAEKPNEFLKVTMEFLNRKAAPTAK